MISKNFFVIIIVLILGFLLINYFSVISKKENIQYVKIAGQNIKVDLANTLESRTKGLSGRQELKENEGMLFVFDHEGLYPFWMKGMNFPIDIIWINKDLKVVYIKKDVSPLSYPETYTSSENAKYILEVVAGFSEKNNLKVGDSVVFTD